MSGTVSDMKPIIWVHEDALSRDHPVFERAGRNARAVFIWDNEDFQSRQLSFKKLVFLYECLEDMNVEIIEGRTAEVLASLCSAQGKLYTARSHNPQISNLINPLRSELDIIEVHKKRLSDVEITADMARFFRFWNKAKKSIMRPEL
jgi:hypothetical protein